MLLLLLVLGYVLTRIGIIPPDGKKLLSALTVNVTLPASILHAFQMEFDAEIARSCVAITLVGLCIQLGGAVLAQLLYRRAPADRRPVLQYGTLVSNSGILGTVIAEGIFGSLGVLYASVYVIPQRIIMWTLGVSYFEGTSDKKAALRWVAMNPCVLAVVLSGTPAPTTVSALATKYGVGEQLAAKCVVASTLLSLATIPLWCLLVR